MNDIHSDSEQHIRQETPYPNTRDTLIQDVEPSNTMKVLFCECPSSAKNRYGLRFENTPTGG